ncbi:hypothetical protein TNCV_3342621 [Trichonephila clavipes]|nr:hypothetical protein TNCV_3342621 [Trichonephila clavipes]
MDLVTFNLGEVTRTFVLESLSKLPHHTNGSNLSSKDLTSISPSPSLHGGSTVTLRINHDTPDTTSSRTATDVVQSGRPIFDDFFQHLWPYIGNNTANVVFQMVKRLWLIRIDQ